MEMLDSQTKLCDVVSGFILGESNLSSKMETQISTWTVIES